MEDPTIRKQFDEALKRCTDSAHPKMRATVDRVVELWENGEKVIVFAFYLHTCSALRRHISSEIERRLTSRAQERLTGMGQDPTHEAIEALCCFDG